MLGRGDPLRRGARRGLRRLPAAAERRPRSLFPSLGRRRVRGADCRPDGGLGSGGPAPPRGMHSSGGGVAHDAGDGGRRPAGGERPLRRRARRRSDRARHPRSRTDRPPPARQRGRARGAERSVPRAHRPAPAARIRHGRAGRRAAGCRCGPPSARAAAAPARPPRGRRWRTSTRPARSSRSPPPTPAPPVRRSRCARPGHARCSSSPSGCPGSGVPACSFGSSAAGGCSRSRRSAISASRSSRIWANWSSSQSTSVMR